MKTLPAFLKKYFWDVDFSELDKEDYPQFVIERILEYGDQKAIKWMKENFKLNEIKKVICQSKNLSLRSANFWRIIFNLNKNDILCLEKSFQQKQRVVWPY